MKKELRPICEFYNSYLISTKHLLFECPYLAEARKTFPQPTNLEDILSIRNLNLLMLFRCCSYECISLQKLICTAKLLWLGDVLYSNVYIYNAVM